MLKIRSIISEDVIDGKLHVVAEMSVASSLELATTDGNMVFEEGSIAWDISTGDFYGYGGETWYKQDGSGAYSAEVTPSVQSVDNGRSLDRPVIDLRQETPEIREEPEIIPEEPEEEPEIKEEEKR